MKTPWLTCHQPQPNPRVRLFCFAHAGAGATFYRRWQGALAEAIEVCPVELPGHWSRLDEPAFTGVPALIAAVAAGLEGWFNRPFALFGNSFGALLAFELAHHLREHRGLEPMHLFAAARGGPQRPRDDDPPRYDLPDSQLLAHIEDRYGGIDPAIRAEPSMLALALRIIRADMQAFETYRYRDRPPLGCPISVYAGDRDRSGSPADYEAWRELTSSTCSVQTLPGGHFFLADHTATLWPQLRAALLTR